MSVYAAIKLLEPIHCPDCGSTIDDVVGTHEDHFEIPFGESKVKCIRPHDGKGGLKQFATHDLVGLFIFPYLFPGFVPSEVYSGGDITLTEVCNKCNTVYSGIAEVSQLADDPYLHIDSIEFHESNRTGGMYMPRPVSDIYDVQFKMGGCVLLEPNQKNAANLLLEKTKKLNYRIKMRQDYLDMINYSKITTIKKSIQATIRKKGKYNSHFLQVVKDYEAAFRNEITTDSALTAALVFLYTKDRKQALEILELSGVQKREEFLNSLSREYDWFVNGTRKNLLSFRGIFGGPNHFLRGISDKA